jgi:cellulose synthase/poly-beta-1,6-N-acetylglucosamine synthase-like glycosyltransferase
MIGLLRRFDRLALPLGLLGLLAVALYNRLLWRRDRRLLEHFCHSPPLPSLDDWPALPRVTVLVAAWNEAGIIHRHIESFLSLRYPHKELVLCAGGDDGTNVLAGHYRGELVKVLEQRPGEGKQRALARAFPAATGEIIFLTDADCLLEDDSFERTLYPVAAGREDVCTGSSRPLNGQLPNPFVRSQAAAHLYGALRAPRYVTGLLGRNAAVRRDLLARCRGLEAPASGGTDYVLAKTLLRAGARIRHVPHSLVATRFPATPGAYRRQQRRWLANVARHGACFGAWGEVRAAWLTSLLALFMLLLPLTWPLAGPPALAGWLLLLAHALFSRLRYRAAAAIMLHSHWSPDITGQLRFLPLDLLAWVQALPVFVLPRGRREW